MQDQSSYDEFPYISYPFHYTWPQHLMTIGKFFGMTLSDISKARVLELGSSCGGNLITFASDHPASYSIGVDISKLEIEHGTKIIKDLGLKNIELRNISITDIDESFGKFDYIICHGVFSWVPDFVKDKILEISSRLLNPNGIAFISYNTMPGWNMVNSIRDMLMFHSRLFDSPADKISQARLFLNFISEALQGSNSPYANFLEQEALNLVTKEDQYILHEYLVGQNEQFYFHEFMSMAKSYNLSYLGDSNIPSMFLGNLPQKAAEKLSTIDNIVRAEQYMDFVSNRRFRRTLLCHEDVILNRNITSEKILEFYSTSNLVASVPLKNIDLNDASQSITFYFNDSQDLSISTSSPIIKSIFYTYQENIGNPLSATELFESAYQKLHNISVEDIKMEFDNVVGRLVLGGYVTLFAIKPNAISYISPKPQVSNTARYQATNAKLDRLFVTNQINEIVQLTIYEKYILELLDGNKGIADIKAEILEKLISGEMVASKSGDPITDQTILENAAEHCVATTLERFRTNYLLVG
jgi:methyltransferase-like protein/2-polyprenyl-3-methyl-5-hydroxy-6-metoxy-1,4-benzoquinol methylase